jgi:3D (Asp-Asp-Asp) domain-containing protein
MSTAAGSGPRVRTIWMQVTAYCGCKKCCGPNACGITASGRSTGYNGGLFVAADTTLLPFNTQLKIPGYAAGEVVEVIDRGSAIKGNHLDVFFSNHDQALAWGRRWVAVVVVE